MPKQSCDTTANVDNTKLSSLTGSNASPIADVLGQSVISGLTQSIELVPLRIDTEGATRFAKLAAFAVHDGSRRLPDRSAIQPRRHFRSLN